MTTQTDAWIESAQQLGRAEFLKRHPGFFLVSSDQFADFSTAIYQTDVVDVIERKSQRGFRQGLEVRWVAKGQDSPYSDRISVGRARNCDVVFRHPSVSTLHAHFRIDRGELTLIDHGSRNGTWVNGERLAPNTSQRVRTQDRLRFGSVDATVLDAPEAFDLLSHVE